MSKDRGRQGDGSSVLSKVRMSKDRGTVHLSCGDKMIFDRLRSLLSKNKTPEQLKEHYDNIELEKGDFLAMVIAALITFLPVLLIVSIVVYGLIWLVFMR